MRNATRAIQAIFRAGFLPSAVEVADTFTLAAARERTGSKLFDGCKAHLIVELDGQEKSVRGELAQLQKLLNPFSPLHTQKGFGDEGVEKPDPQIFRIAEERSQMDDKRLIYMGDRVDKDISGAQGAGWDSILFRSVQSTSDDQATFEIDHWSELPALLLS